MLNSDGSEPINAADGFREGLNPSYKAFASLPMHETQAIDAQLHGAIEKNAIPGVVVMAADRKGVIYRARSASPTSAWPSDAADAMFRIASMTKAITSIAAMQLVEQNRFALDDPVEKYLPEFAKLMVFELFDGATGAYRLRPATKPVTVRHLFTHTSGLGYGFTSPTVRDFKPRAGEEYAVGPLQFEPGERWLYSTSTDWLGRLVEKVSGQPLEDYFRQHIFDAARDVRHLLLRAEGQGGAPGDGQPPAARRHRWRRTRSSRRHRASRRSAAAACRRPRTTTSASPGRCSTAASSTARRILSPAIGRADGPKPHRRGRRAGAQDRAAGAQRRLLVRRRRPRQVGPRIPDHDRRGARQTLGRQPELGRHQQHLLLARSGPAASPA